MRQTPPEHIIRAILQDLKVELSDEFDKNFSTGSFFGKKWKNRADGRATHLNNSGTLRRSITAEIHQHAIEFFSQVPYAAIHNEGGQITITAKMKRFFWYKYLSTGQASWFAMARMKVGSKITIPQRQFIGDHPKVSQSVDAVIYDHLNRYADQLHDSFKQ